MWIGKRQKSCRDGCAITAPMMPSAAARIARTIADLTIRSTPVRAIRSAVVRSALAIAIGVACCAATLESERIGRCRRKPRIRNRAVDFACFQTSPPPLLIGNGRWMLRDRQCRHADRRRRRDQRRKYRSAYLQHQNNTAQDLDAPRAVTSVVAGYSAITIVKLRRKLVRPG